jgi:hypothetical protein
MLDADTRPNSYEKWQLQLPFRMNQPKFMGESTMADIVDEVLKRSGVKTPEAMRTHAFRKGFKSICEQSGMKSLHVEMLKGHHIPLVDSYYRPQEKDILEDFRSHTADALMIDPTQRLQKENQELKSERTEEIAQLKARVQQQGECFRQI